MTSAAALRAMIDLIPIDAQRVLLLGRGDDRLRRHYQRRNPGVRWLTMDHLALGDGARSPGGEVPDVVIMPDSENPDVLASALGEVLRAYDHPMTCVLAVPNAGGWRAVSGLLRDGASRALELESPQPRGVGLSELRRIVDDAGWILESLHGVSEDAPEDGKEIDVLVAAAIQLGADEQAARQQLSTSLWLARCVNRQDSRRTVAALTIRKVAGVNEARIDYPLRALQSVPGHNLVWGANIGQIPGGWPPGVFILHRIFLNRPELIKSTEQLIASGWVVISDIDDDPRHWQGFRDSDFFAFRGVHAVSVSTERLAALVAEWNPNVQVLENAIFELPMVGNAVPKTPGRLKVFFGALNRTGDWMQIESEVIRAMEDAVLPLELVVVHDRAVFDRLPNHLNKTFHPTLSLAEYGKVLAESDIALLPLQDNDFNWLKSDLKFIECCAAGTVPICSPVVYSERPEHREIGCMVEQPGDWYRHLTRLSRHPEELAARRALALRYVASTRMHAHQTIRRQQFYQSLMARREQLEAERQARLALLNHR